MFCMKCGAKLPDNAAFCMSCGNKIEYTIPATEEKAMDTPVVEAPVMEAPVMEAPVMEVPVMETPVVETPVIETPVMEAPVVEAPVMEEPVIEAPVVEETFIEAPVVAESIVDIPVMPEVPVMQEAPAVQETQSYAQPIYTQPVYTQPTFQQPTYNQPVQPVYNQPVVQNAIPSMPKKKGSKATVPAVIFGLLSLVASVLIAVDFFINKKDGLTVGIENIVFALTSIFVIVYAVSKSAASSVLKGVSLLAVLALHVIFYGISAFRSVFVIFGDANSLTDIYYAVILLIELICLYIYLLICTIKSFANSKKASTFTLLLGYLAAILMIAVFVVDCVSIDKNIFAMKFIPVDAGLILLIIADIFATIARAKKMEQ